MSDETFTITDEQIRELRETTQREKKLTADTITDEDIRGMCPRQGEPLYLLAEVALSRRASPDDRREARARCAEILNARGDQ